MQHKTTQHLVLVSLLSLVSVNAMAEGWDTNVRTVLGAKHLKKSDWNNQDKHSSIGLIVDFKPESWPVAAAVDMFGTGEHKSSSNEKSYSAELHLGGRYSKAFMQERLIPYVGAGLASGYAKFETPEKDEEGRGTGAWVGLGVDVKVYKQITLGLDARYSNMKATVLDKKRNIGGTNLGVTLGYQF